jgi:SAM-dependent methyltransferase
MTFASRLISRLAVLDRRPYVPAEYWEGRAADLIQTYDHPETWPERGWVREGAEDETVPRILTETGCRSVLVVGAGTGRQYGYLEGFDAYGFDISPTLVAEASSRYPNVSTVVGSVIGCERLFGQKDAVVSSAVLGHIPPASIVQAVQSVKASAAKTIIVREYTAIGRRSKYQFAHDYVRLMEPWRVIHRETTDRYDGFEAELIAFGR